MKLDGKSATKLASIALLSLVVASCKNDDLKFWLASTPLEPPTDCPTNPPAPDPTSTEKPYFKLGAEARKAKDAGRKMSCLEDGPYAWNGSQWYMQRIKFVDEGGQERGAVRVCSVDAVEGEYGPARDLVVDTPGGPLSRVGPNKCQMVASH